MKTRHFQKLSQNLVLLSLFTIIGLLPLDASAQTVVSRARLGGYAEDITYVTSGALKDQVVMMNGYELYALNREISLEPSSLGHNFGLPVGLAYLPHSDEFVVSFNGTPPMRAHEQQRLRVISRAGILVRTIDLSASGALGKSRATT